MKNKILHVIFFLCSVYLYRLLGHEVVFNTESVTAGVAGSVLLLTSPLGIISISAMLVFWIISTGVYPQIQNYMYGIILIYLAMALYRKNVSAAISTALFVATLTFNVQSMMMGLKNTPLANVPNANTTLFRQMSYKVTRSKVKCDPDLFNEKVLQISAKHQIDPGHLLFVMWAESGIDVASVNLGSNAIGLIQFMPSTCVDIGSTRSKIKAMNGIQQLEMVSKYMDMFPDKIKMCDDIYKFYLLFFYPAAIPGIDNDYVFSNAVINANKVIFVDGNNYAEFKNYVDKRMIVAGIGL